MSHEWRHDIVGTSLSLSLIFSCTGMKPLKQPENRLHPAKTPPKHGSRSSQTRKRLLLYSVLRNFRLVDAMPTRICAAETSTHSLWRAFKINARQTKIRACRAARELPTLQVQGTTLQGGPCRARLGSPQERGGQLDMCSWDKSLVLFWAKDALPEEEGGVDFSFIWRNRLLLHMKEKWLDFSFIWRRSRIT